QDGGPPQPAAPAAVGGARARRGGLQEVADVRGGAQRLAREAPLRGAAVGVRGAAPRRRGGARGRQRLGGRRGRPGSSIEMCSQLDPQLPASQRWGCANENIRGLTRSRARPEWGCGQPRESQRISQVRGWLSVQVQFRSGRVGVPGSNVSLKYIAGDEADKEYQMKYDYKKFRDRAPAEELPPQGAAALPPEPDDAASEAASGSEERGDEIGSELGVKQDELESAKRELEEEEAPPQGAVAKVENEERSPEAAAPQAEEEEAAQDDPPAGAPQVGEFVDVHGIGHSIVRCNRCCRTAKECNYRIKAKGQSTYQCDACNTNGVRLSRRFGQWPPKCFAKMKSEFKQQFYKDLAEDPGLSNLDRIEAFVVSSITVQRMEEERVRKGGKYLPLRKWAHDGFDAKKIEDNVQDKRWNPDLGEWTYRPQLEAAWSETVEAAVRNELYTDKRTQAKQSGPRAAASTGVAEHGGDKGDRSDESDMSRSRSRSRGDRDRSKSRRKGRSKSRGKSKDRSKSRDKDAEKERRRQEAREKAEQAKKETQEKNLALKWIGTATRLETELDGYLEHEKADKVPSWAVKNAKAARKSVAVMKAVAQKRVHSGVALTITQDEAISIQKDASSAARAIAGMLKEAQKHST
ncbi:unnamed protein product, partial [Prorocentrum cordatum]